MKDKLRHILNNYERSIDNGINTVFVYYNDDENKVAFVDFEWGWVKIGEPRAIFTGMHDPMLDTRELERQIENGLFEEAREDFYLLAPRSFHPQLDGENVFVDVELRRNGRLENYPDIKIRLDDFKRFDIPDEIDVDENGEIIEHSIDTNDFEYDKGTIVEEDFVGFKAKVLDYNRFEKDEGVYEVKILNTGETTEIDIDRLERDFSKVSSEQGES